MSFIALSKDSTFELNKSGDVLVVKDTAALPESTLCVACWDANTFYVTVKGEAQKLHKWTRSTNALDHVGTFPSDVKKVFLFQSKVYGIPQSGQGIFIFDPVCREMETLPTHHAVSNCEPADHGLVFHDAAGQLYGVHFNKGITKVQGLQNCVLLGTLKRCAVAYVPSEKMVVGVNESGGVVRDIFPNVCHQFCSMGEETVEYDAARNAFVLDGTRKVDAPANVDKVQLVCSIHERDEEEVCTLCLCEFDGPDGVTLDCGHMFHKDCVEQWVSTWEKFKEKAEHVVFTNAVCPAGCKRLVRHPLIPQSKAINTLFDKISRMTPAILRLMESTKVDDDVLFYICHSCGEPYFGGEKVCFRMLSSEPSKKPEELLCEKCQTDFSCPTHKRDFVLYKCKFCCNPATSRSFSTRYICDRCDKRWEKQEPDAIPCGGPSKCPLGGNHKEGCFPLGCLACLAPNFIQYEHIVQPPPADAVA